MNRPRIAVIDDDEFVRESLPDLLREFGYDADAFESAADFLNNKSVSDYVCLVLDIAMPGMTGIDLRREIELRGYRVPIVFITAHGDEELWNWLRRQGVEFLKKPFGDTALLAALRKVLSTAAQTGR